MRKFAGTCSAVVALGWLCAFGNAQDKTAPAVALPTNEQMRHIKAMGDPQLSPDGTQVLLRITDATADGAKSHIWLINTAGRTPRQLTYTPDSDKRGERSAQWMPDGQSVLFLARRGEHTSLYRLPMAGGEAKAYDLKVAALVDESKLPGALPTPAAEEAKEKKAGEKTEAVGDEVAIDVENFRIAPDGKTLALLVNDPETPGEKKQKEAKADAEWVNHGLHRTRLYLMKLDDSADAERKLTLVAVPVDVRAAEWSADSSKLVALAEEPNGLDELGPDGSAWLVTKADPVHPTRLTDVPATVGAAVWSLDGTQLVYLAQAKQDAPPGYPDAYVYTLSTKTTRNLSDGYQGSVGRSEPIALQDGGLVEGVEQGLDAAFLRYAADGTSQPVRSPFADLSTLTTNAARSGWVFLGSSGGKPTHLIFAARLGEEPRVLLTPELAPKGLQTVAPKRLAWKNEKYEIEGLLYLPPQPASGKIPLVVDVHGGPLGAFNDAYETFVDYLLGQGWAVLRVNPRGSTGRGAAFAAANKNDLGGGDYRDIMSGVDYVLKTEPEVDAERLGLMGYSYGGEMAGFVEVKTTRFKAIVSMAPVIDQNSEYGTERGSWYDQWYFGKPWLHQSDAWRQSPLSGVDKAKTPFLLMQGEGDTTDPLGQSLEMYHALRQMGVAVDLVTYPRDDHGPLAGAIFGSPSPEPWHGFDARQRIVSFFTKAFATAH